jgi:hypothetical protein
MSQLQIDFDLRILWEFDLGSNHIVVKADALDRTYLFTTPREVKR